MNLKRIDANDPVKWIIENDSKSLNISGNLGILEKFVDAFVREIRA